MAILSTAAFVPLTAGFVWYPARDPANAKKAPNVRSKMVILREPIIPMLTSRILLALLCIIGTQPLYAQSVKEADCKLYTRIDGLSSNYVSGIIQDSTGFIWVATNKGLNRFDGRFFLNYYRNSSGIPLTDNLIKALTMQRDEIIATTIAGGFVLNPYTGATKKLIVPADPAIFWWTNYGTETLRDPSGRYIFSSRTGLYVFDSAGKLNNRYDHYRPEDARHRELFFGGSLSQLRNGWVLQYNDSSFSAYDPVTDHIDPLFDVHLPAFKKAVTDSLGMQRVTFRGPDDQVLIKNEEKSTLDIFDFTRNQSFPSPMPATLLADINEYSKIFYLRDTLIAITGRWSGFYLLRYDPAVRRLSLRGQKSFAGRHCTAIFLDRENRFWVGATNGLYKQNLSSPSYDAYDLAAAWPDLVNYELRAITGQGGRLFMSFRSDGGMVMMDMATHKPLRRFDFSKYGSRSNNIPVIFPFDKDTIWLGTSQGILWLDTRNFQSGRVVLSPELDWGNKKNPICMLDDGKGNVWISYGKINTILRYNRATRRFTDISSSNSHLALTYCFNMEKDKAGNVWFAGDGLCRWNAAKQKIDTLILYPSVGGSLTSYLGILGMDSAGSLWLFSYNNGIIEYRLDENKMMLRNGQWDDDILTSSPVVGDHIWLGIDNGLAVFNTKDYSTRLFTYADGLPSVPVTSFRKNSWYDPSGDVFYFGSGHQLVGVKPDPSNGRIHPPALFIERISTPGRSFRGNTAQLELPYADNSFQIEFNTVNFHSAEENRFAYRVTPSADTGWQMLNTQPTVSFNNVVPGKYRIQLKLFSVNHRWPDQTREIWLVVRPPFWKTGWFIALLVGVFLAGVGLVYRYRIKTIKEKANLDRLISEYEIKALHAQMNPHFIFNALNSIREMMLHHDDRNASLYLSLFADMIRLNLTHSGKNFITLKEHVDYLAGYLAMEQLRFSDFQYTITVEEGLDLAAIRLPPMLIQPLAENAIWHGLLPSGDDKQLRMSFYTRKDKLVCEIDDNGIGIRQSLLDKSGSAPLRESVGINNIRRRMAILNEKYQMECCLDIRDKSELPGAIGSGTVAMLMVQLDEDPFN
jgi:hypothetical protein